MTEFEKFWERNESVDKEYAKKVWDAAQRACIRCMNTPPYVPAPGDKVIVTPCHPKFQNQPQEVIEVEKVQLEAYYLTTKCMHNGEEAIAGGVMGEVFKVG